MTMDLLERGRVMTAWRGEAQRRPIDAAVSLALIAVMIAIACAGWLHFVLPWLMDGYTVYD